MIANALIFPTEFPPHVDDVKRALLTYDHVNLYAPDDRDLMPSEFYNMAAAGIPMGFSGVPVRPLGKTTTYDEAFERLLEECRPALDQGSLQLLPSAARQVDSTMKASGLVLGSPAPPPNQANPAFLLHSMRALAMNHRIMTGIGRGLDVLPLLTDENLEHLAPRGLDDQHLTYEVVGVTPAVSLPAPALYDGFAHNDTERISLTRICVARIGALVRALAHCEMLGLEPFTSDPGYASALQQLSANAREVIDDEAERLSADDDMKSARLLTRLHNLVVSEFVDTEALSAMPIREVLRLRSRAWEAAGEGRQMLGRTLVELSRRCGTKEEFDAECRIALEEYRRARADLDSEATQLKMRVFADIGKVTFAGLGGSLGAEVAQRFVQVGSLAALLSVGGFIFMKAVGERGPEVMQILHLMKERDRLPGCGLARPYSPFLR